MSYQQAAELWLADNWLRMTSCQFGGTGRKDWKGTKGWKAAETRSAYWTPRRKGLLGSFLSAAQVPNPNVSDSSGDSPSTLRTAPPRSARTASSQRRGSTKPAGCRMGETRTCLTSDLNWRHWQVHKSEGRLSTPSYPVLQHLIWLITQRPFRGHLSWTLPSPASQATLQGLLPCTHLCYLGKYACACYVNYLLYDSHYIIH